MDQQTLIARIQERLETLKKDPVPLGTAIGKGRDYVTDILNGRKKTIPNDVITPLAIALRCDERYFTDSDFTEPGQPRPKASPEDMERFAIAAERFDMFAWAWRMYRGLTLKDVEAETGLSAGTVSDIEQGIRDPSDEERTALARAFSTQPGLLSSNPFLTNERLAHLVSITERLTEQDQQTLLEMAEAFDRRRSA